MESQFNSDSNVTRSDTTSTSKDGLSTIPAELLHSSYGTDEEYPTIVTGSALHVLYSNPTMGTLMGGLDQLGNFQIHSVLMNPTENLSFFKTVVEELETVLKAKGFKQYYTVADNKHTYRLCKAFGFKSAYVHYDNYEMMVKCL